jgi:hypothetical protein
MTSGCTFLIVSFIIGAIIVSMIGASLLHYILVCIGFLVVLWIVQHLAGFQ